MIQLYGGRTMQRAQEIDASILDTVKDAAGLDHKNPDFDMRLVEAINAVFFILHRNIFQEYIFSIEPISKVHGKVFGMLIAMRWIWQFECSNA